MTKLGTVDWFVGRSALAALAVLVVACGDDGETGDTPGGSGKASFNTWGEEYIEDRIPTGEFADGWSVSYSKFLVVIGHITVAEQAGASNTWEGTKLFDHRKTGVKDVHTFDLEAKAWDRVSYEIPPADAATELAGASEEDKALLVDQGASVRVEGILSKGDVEKTFAWSFTRTTTYSECEGEKDGAVVEGVVVTNGGTDDVQLTIHGDHLFYDDLASPDAVLRGDPIAKADDDGNADGEITLEELAAVDLNDVEAGTYGTGAADVNDLRTFVESLSSTIGHYRGEGECKSSARE